MTTVKPTLKREEKTKMTVEQLDLKNIQQSMIILTGYLIHYRCHHHHDLSHLPSSVTKFPLAAVVSSIEAKQFGLTAEFLQYLSQGFDWVCNIQ